MNKYPHVPVGSVLVRRGPGRNDPCPCGATEERPDLTPFVGGLAVRRKKFKKCCGKPKKGQGNA